VVGDLAIPVAASIGIHVATDDDDYQPLLRAADGAMYDAKHSGPVVSELPQACVGLAHRTARLNCRRRRCGGR
jgi:GGDEF domain-containing protein